MSSIFERGLTSGPRGVRTASGGFTLVELVLATLISSLVIGILSVALTFSLRTWERQQNRKPSDMIALLDHMKMQLAQFDPTYIRIDGESRPMFQGETNSLVFATAHSVKAISNGVPVVARYVYDEREKKLYYAEMPLDTYHTDAIKEFLRIKPSTSEKSWPRFFAAEAAGFSLTFGGREKGSATESWGEEEAPLPSSVLVKWTVPGESESNVQLIIPNFIFPLKTDKPGAAGANQAPLQGMGGITQ